MRMNSSERDVRTGGPRRALLARWAGIIQSDEPTQPARRLLLRPGTRLFPVGAVAMRQSILQSRALIAVCALALPAVTASAQSGHLRFDANALAVAEQNAPAQPAAPGSSRTLSMDEAVRLALEQNLGIRIQRYDPQVQDVGIAQAKSFWAPNLASAFNRNNTNQPATSVIVPSYENGTTNANVTLNQLLPWGGSYTAGWINQRVTTTNILQNYS